MIWVIAMLAAYASGSIPFGLIIGRARGVDVRTKGSGNIGATNVGRVLGRRWGMLCFGLDVLKGLAPALVAGLAAGVLGAASIPAVDAAGWLGVMAAAVVGHMFPVWLRFRGGKGVATGLGGCLGVFPFLTIPAGCAFVVWIVSVKLTRLVGVSSCLAAVSLPVFVYVWHGLGVWGRVTGAAAPVSEGVWVFLGGTTVLGAVVVVKHRGNLVRTFRGEEPRIGTGNSAH